MTLTRITSTNKVIDDKGDLDADSHSILARWRNYFSQILNIHGVNDIMQTELHTAEPLVHEPSASEDELAAENVKSHKSPGTEQIPTEMIKAGGRTIHCEIHKLISISCLRSGWSRSEYLSMRRAIKQIVVIVGAYHFCQLHTKFYLTLCCQG